MSRWRLAARLARREVRRHWARSALVVLIIALPVLAAQAGAILWQSARAIDDVNRLWPGSDPSTAGADQIVGFDPRLGYPEAPTGTVRQDTGFSIQDWVPARRGRGQGPDDLAHVELVAYIADASGVAAAEGALPATRRQVLLSPDLADTTGLGPGDTLAVQGSRVDLEVAGVADASGPWDGHAWVGPPVGGDDWVPDTVIHLRSTGSQLVDAELYALFWTRPGAGAGAPDPMLPDDAPFGGALARESRRQQVETVVVTAAVTTMVVGFVAITCSSAFAIGARRQLRQLGTLSAAGASPSDLRRAVLLQGTTLGFAGAALATALVYVGRGLVVRELVQANGDWWLFRGDADLRWIVARPSGWIVGIAALGVLAGTAAALVPALTASRIPVLSALAGRRPLSHRPMRSPHIGAGVLAVGLILLSWSSAEPRGTESRGVFVVVAVLLTMAGTVALAPAVVASVSGLCARVGGTTRLAGRSLVRNGMRTGAVVATTAVAVALPTIVLVYEARDLGEGDRPSEEREHIDAVEGALREVALVWVGGGEAGTLVDQHVMDVVGGDIVVADRIRGRYGATIGFDSAVDPDQLRRVTGDDLVADALARGDLVSIGSRRSGTHPTWGVGSAGSTAEVDLSDRDTFTVAIDDVSPLTLVLLDQSEHGLVARQDGDPTPRSTLFAHPGSLADAEIDALYDLRSRAAPPTVDALRDLESAPDTSAVELSVSNGYPGDAIDLTPWAVLGAALLALAVIGTAMALAAADGRSDDLVVAAVGAPPGAVRRRRVLEAAMTAGAASVLGGGVGVVATLVVIHNPGVEEDGVAGVVRLPILEVLGTAGGIVALVGGATWFVLAVGARLRGRRDIVLVDG